MMGTFLTFDLTGAYVNVVFHFPPRTSSCHSPMTKHTCDLRILHKEQEPKCQRGARCLCPCIKHIPYGDDQVVHVKLRPFVLLFLERYVQNSKIKKLELI